MVGGCLRSPGLTWALGAFMATTSLGAAGAGPADASQTSGDSFGLVITDLYFGIHQTQDAKDCPQGLNSTHRTNYLKQFPTYTARTANDLKYGYGYVNRGPNGENALYSPEVVVDPIPYNLAIGAIAPGINLDGKADANDFVSPDRRTGIDNQMQRVLGCVGGFRGPGGFFYQAGNAQIRSLRVNRLMFEISRVDDLRNDPDVTVRSYRGLDPIISGAGDKAVAGTTQRVDYERGRRYMSETTGRIVDGVLVTEPVDLRVPWVRGTNPCCEVAYTNEFTLRAMQLRVKLTPTGGEGEIAGFADLELWWNWFARGWAAGSVIETMGATAPSMWSALKEQADAYPDQRGVNTAISTTLSAKFTRVIVAHGDNSAPSPQVASKAHQEVSR